MALKHIITLGYGFADGVAFIPTLGYTPGVAVSIEPGCVHGTEAAVYSVLGSAAVLHSVAVTAVALYAVAGSEETC